jgi:hypothetical protein
LEEGCLDDPSIRARRVGAQARDRRDFVVTKRSTVQQRARDLQRAERAQGLNTSYHHALNRVRAAAGLVTATQPANPDPVRFDVPYQRTATEEAEAALSNELWRRRDELMKSHTHTQLAAIVRRGWGGGKLAPERWSKQQLANHIVLGDDMDERYEAYGRVGLLNGDAYPNTRPHCGGTDCTGHDGQTPWPATRARFRDKAPCIGAGAELGVHHLSADATLAQRVRAESLWTSVDPDQTCRCSGGCHHGGPCPAADFPGRGCDGRLQHIERVAEAGREVTAWMDGYQCSRCRQTARQHVTLPDLAWDGSTTDAVHQGDAVPQGPRGAAPSGSASSSDT